MTKNSSNESLTFQRAVRAAVKTALEKLEVRGPSEDIRQLRTAVSRLQKQVDKLSDAALPGRRSKARNPGKPGRPPLHLDCTVKGCVEPHYALGLCSRHYQQRRRHTRSRRGAAARRAAARG